MYKELGFHGRPKEKRSDCLILGHEVRLACSSLRSFLQSDRFGVFGDLWATTF